MRDIEVVTSERPIPSRDRKGADNCGLGTGLQRAAYRFHVDARSNR